MNNYDDHNLQPNAPFRVALTLATVLTLLSGAAYGQVPTTNDTSDPNGNTGMGNNALGGPAASNAGSSTRPGYQALFPTRWRFNTASGFLGARVQHDRFLQHRLRGQRADFQHNRLQQHRHRGLRRFIPTAGRITPRSVTGSLQHNRHNTAIGLSGALLQYVRLRKHRPPGSVRSFTTRPATTTPPRGPTRSRPTRSAITTPLRGTVRSIETRPGATILPPGLMRFIPIRPAATTPLPGMRRSFPT